MPTRHVFAAAVVVSSALFSVSRAAPHPAAGAQQRGDTIVRLAGAPRYRGIATLVEEVSIGRENGPPEYQFSRVRDLHPFPDASVLVVDMPLGGRGAGGAFVRLYDSAGRYTRTFGRSGEGPGEYTQPSGIARLRDGRVLVKDGSSRLNVYAATGASVATWTLESSPGMVSPSLAALLVDTAGYIYRAAALRARGRGDPSPIPAGMIRSRSDGSVIDTIPEPTFPAAPSYDRTLMTASPDANSSFSYLLPYWPYASWGWSPLGYMVTGVPTSYAIDLRIPAVRTGGAATWRQGDPVISIRRNVAPVPVSDAERDDRRTNIEAALRFRAPNWRWRAPEIPRVKPAYSGFRIGADGRLWVHVALPSVPRTVTAADEASAARGCGSCGNRFAELPIYDVFEPDGTYLGQVRLPERINPMVFRGDNVWGVVLDQNDLPTVKRWRIAWVR